MNVSKLLGIGTTLETLEQLGCTIRDCTAREDQLKGSLRQEIGRVEKKFRTDVESFDTQIKDQVEKIEGSGRSRRDGLRYRISNRSNWIDEAAACAREKRLHAIESCEGRKISGVQRQLLEVSRKLETGQGAAEKALNDLRRETSEVQDAIEKLELKAYSAFRGYGTFRKWLLKEPGAADAGSDKEPPTLLEETRSQLKLAGRKLGAFRLHPVALLFYLLPPWIFLMVLAVGHVGLFFLMPNKGHLDYPWQLAAIWFGASAVGMFVLHLIGRFTAGGAAGRLVQSIEKTRALLDGTNAAADRKYEREFQIVQTASDRESGRWNAEWNDATNEGERSRAELEALLSRKLARARDRNERLLQFSLKRLGEDVQRTTEQLNTDAGATRARLTEEFTRRKTELETEQTQQWLSLESDWNTDTHAAYLALSDSLAESNSVFSKWDVPVCESWKVRSAFIPFARFGYVQVDVPGLAGTMPVDHRLQLKGGHEITVPLMLEFPAHGNILFETKETGRDQVISSFNNLILRLLSVAPAGRAVFTILDPVDLGQSFAGLMHLTDHEDRLINRKIWTQPDHIEQRLAELNEHIEKVTQLYLRNEYNTIAEYNEKAGRIAEPYHFLVIADFPVNFTETAVKRLQSIAASGPRCGVFLLMHWDQRKPVPNEFVPDDLRKVSVCLKAQGDRFVLSGHKLPGIRLTLDQAPDADLATLFLKKVGQSSVDSNRVEVPFADIAPDEASIWSLETTVELRTPIGRTGATKLQQLALGKGTRQHVLVAGKTGSGKSTLFHVMITNLALWSSPEDVEFYLVDFKKGVEFKCYGTQRLPHARVVAIESDREFGLSVLERVDEELKRRGDLFRKAGAQDLSGYKRESGEKLPRTLLIIDEFQEFFTEDDRVAQNAALLLDRLVRQGRAFGIHVILGSQTLGGAYTLARTTLGQMVVRIALQCNEADALLIMEDDNPAPRLLSRPGEAIYNDASGAIEGNSPFQIVWFSDEERDRWLGKIREHADNASKHWAAPIVFEGNAPADIRENVKLSRLLTAAPAEFPVAAGVFLGAPNSIKGPTEVVFSRQSGNNLLIIGQQDESALAMLGIGLISLASQHRPGSARFILIDGSPAGSSHRSFIETVVEGISQDVTLVGAVELKDAMASLAEEFAKRNDAEYADGAPTVYVIVHGMQRFKQLRAEDDFNFSLDDAAGGGESPGTTFNNITCEGAQVGMHVIASCDSLNNVNRQISRKALSEFELRVLFQMSANDSATLMDSPKASTLGMHRAILYNSQQGSAEVFRPYSLPGNDWLEEIGRAEGAVAD